MSDHAVLSNISVFGNPDLSFDSVPIRLVPILQKHFPDVSFTIEDPNEIDLPKSGIWIILDTVRGLRSVEWICIEDIAKRSKMLTAHDYDLSTLLLLAKKLDASFEPKILGIPEGVSEKDAVDGVVEKLKNFLNKAGKTVF